VAACGRSEQRRRLLPARLVVGFVLALARFSPAPYLGVLRHLVEGLGGVGRWGAWRIPAKSSLFGPGSGWAPSRCGCCLPPRPGRWPRRPRPGRSGGACGCWRSTGPAGRWRTPRPTTRRWGVPAPTGARGAGRFAQVRMAALVECGTHAVVDAELDGCRVGEVTLAARLVRSAGPGMLVLPRPGVPGAPGWRALAATALTCCGGGRPTGSLRSTVPCRTGRGCLCRSAAGTGPPGATRCGWSPTTWTILDGPTPGLPAGHHVAGLGAPPGAGTGGAVWPTVGGGDRAGRGQDPPARRWGGAGQQDPDGTRQQVWAHLLVHHALRALLYRTAGAGAGGSTATGSALSTRCAPCGAASPSHRAWFPPERLITALVWLRDDLLAHLLPTRRLRGQPRVVKRKMSNFGVKRGVHRHWPQPTKPPAQAVAIPRALPPPDP
jgi:Insertion element 4 transposase N-terminal